MSAKAILSERLDQIAATIKLKKATRKGLKQQAERVGDEISALEAESAEIKADLLKIDPAA